MTSTKFALRLAAASIALAAAPLAAQVSQPGSADDQPSEPAAAAADCCAIPALQMIEIEIADTVTSRANRPGDMFAIRLAEPIVVNGRTIVAAGAAGKGEVIHAAKAGGMGKAGELILAVRYLEVNGERISLRSLRYGRSQGKDNSGAVMAGNAVASAVLPLASVVGFLVKGGEVHIPAGTRANAKVSTETRVAPAE